MNDTARHMAVETSLMPSVHRHRSFVPPARLIRYVTTVVIWSAAGAYAAASMVQIGGLDHGSDHVIDALGGLIGLGMALKITRI